MTEATTEEGATPRFTIVTAVYNVARYLPEFIASIDAQTIDANDLHVVAVDDGSTDESLEILERWADRSQGRVTVVSKENGGQGSARNLGLEHARGEWVTFTDPDDTLSVTYFTSVAKFLDRHPETDLVMTKLILHEEAQGRMRDAHPRKYMFVGGDRLVDLDRFPDHYPGSAPASFFRLSRIREMGLTYDERVRPHFEDGHFSCRYMFGGETMLVGCVGSAKYFYRKRADASSTLQRSVADPDRYTEAPRYGYLAILKEAAEKYGRPPEWLQSLILYELGWYFSTEDQVSGRATAAVSSVGDTFIELLREIAGYLDNDVIYAGQRRPYAGPWREVLAHSMKEEQWHSPYVVSAAFDNVRQEVRLQFRYWGPEPEVSYYHRGLVVEPSAQKTRDITYFGSVLLREKIAWVPARGTVRVRLDGSWVSLRSTYPGAERTMHRPKDIAKAFPATDNSIRLKRGRVVWSHSVPELARLRLVRGVLRRLFGRPWILVDRLHDSADSAEVLFRYLREHRPDVNAWFVVEKGTSDWKRLRADGFRRVVSPESFLWKVLMSDAELLISSHIDVPIYRPQSILKHVRPSWKFAFLQHGVIKDDLSRWLNSKSISLFVTSTPDEYQSIVEDGSPYTFTSKEVKMTGLPRFDALMATDASVPDKAKNLVLVAPTWRHWLTPPSGAGSQRRSVVDGFWSSDFAQAWRAILESEALRDACDRAGFILGFLPHPNLQSSLQGWELPAHVQPLSFDQDNVQEIFARCKVMVTDYSSMAFNTAFLGRSAVYYQFDAERVRNGDHVGRQGYFDYESHGFGPVVFEHEAAVTAITDAITQGGVPEPEYQERIDQTFVLRDGRSSERVVAELEDLLGRRR